VEAFSADALQRWAAAAVEPGVVAEVVANLVGEGVAAGEEADGAADV
jgi:hypothetical protein